MPALGKLRQDARTFQAGLGYLARPGLGNTVSNKTLTPPLKTKRKVSPVRQRRRLSDLKVQINKLLATGLHGCGAP